MTAALCAVAGCLFEVHLPQSPDGDEWQYSSSDGAPVTLLGQPEIHRFRFRAEQPGDVTLMFTCGAPTASERLTVHITPERLG